MRTFLALVVVVGLLAAQAAFGGGPGGGKGGGGGGWGGGGGSWGGGGGSWGKSGWGGGYGGYYGWGHPGWGGYYGNNYGYGQVTSGYWPQTTANPLPQAQAPAEVVNPATTGVTLSFNVNGQAYSLAPGMKQDLTISPGDTVSFDRGGSFGAATYSLNPAIYTFAATNNGWELYQQAMTAPGGQPTATAGANALPGNPPSYGR
jgi:hypothetical protein